MRHDRMSHRIGIALLGVIGLLVVVLACSPAQAQEAPAAPKEQVQLRHFGLIVPPARYMGDASYRIVTSNPGAVHRVCLGGDPPPLDTIILACTYMKVDVMLMPNPCLYAATERYAMLLCHEQAHVNGWPPDHPDE